ncbi:MAG: HEPN domain-containing protein [Candidatus Omnitrophota bacterium]|nr:HEPN domain-containing protein [Candidatus Omnitrophota bacterium]
MDKVKVSKIDRNLYTNYLVRAEECLSAARHSLSLNQWNASAISAIHSGIASLDALCVYYLGQRHAGANHEDAITLFKNIKQLPREDIDTIANRVIKILKMKNMAEYEERLVHQTEAQNILKNAERLLEAVKSKLPK